MITALEMCETTNWPTAIMWIGIAAAASFAIWSFFKYMNG